MRKFKFSLPIVKVYKDIVNYRSWCKTIQSEGNNPNSKFRKFDMDYNFFYIIYLIISLPEEDRVLPDNIKKLRVVETLKPIHQYLDEDLGFADYIVPEFNQFFDDKGEPTLNYGVVYKFAFKKLSFRWIISRLIFLILLIYGLNHFSSIINFIKNIL